MGRQYRKKSPQPTWTPYNKSSTPAVKPEEPSGDEAAVARSSSSVQTASPDPPAEVQAGDSAASALAVANRKMKSKFGERLQQRRLADPEAYDIWMADMLAMSLEPKTDLPPTPPGAWMGCFGWKNSVKPKNRYAPKGSPETMAKKRAEFFRTEDENT